MRRTTHSKQYNFITITVVGWIDVFTRTEYKDFIVQSLQHCQKHKGLEIYAYVIMTNHLHLVVYDSANPLSDVLRDFKTYTSKMLFKMIEQNPHESRKQWMIALFKKAGQQNPLNLHHQFWQNENHPVALATHGMMQQKIDYIHQNPVKAGFVNEAYEYLYSSASPLSPIKVMEA